jgi:lysozyme family protein
MTMRTFTDALAVVLREEGGFVHDARDPGGATNLGVTARTWAQWSGAPATDATMRALTPAKVAPLYKAWFWDKIGGDVLPIGLALAAFDFAVNAGPGTAMATLQRIVGAPPDGRCGATTQRALQAYLTAIGPTKLITRFCDARRDHYRALPTFSIFGKGWLARVDRVEREVLSWNG